MYCKYCGADIPDDSEFCEKCGKKLKGAIHKKDVFKEKPQAGKKPAKKINKLAIILGTTIPVAIIIVVLSILASLGFFTPGLRTSVEYIEPTDQTAESTAVSVASETSSMEEIMEELEKEMSEGMGTDEETSEETSGETADTTSETAEETAAETTTPANPGDTFAADAGYLFQNLINIQGYNIDTPMWLAEWITGDVKKPCYVNGFWIESTYKTEEWQIHRDEIINNIKGNLERIGGTFIGWYSSYPSSEQSDETGSVVDFTFRGREGHVHMVYWPAWLSDSGPYAGKENITTGGISYIGN